MNTIYLCGFMGCGKSTVGRVLSDMLGCAFTDMDTYIEQTENMSIPQIFAEKGETYFRDAEAAAVEALGSKGGVIACGGGAMLRQKNAEIALRYGNVVYIDTSFEDCWVRIEGDTNRPVVMANTKQSLETLYNERARLYAAHSSVKAEGTGAPEEIAEKIRKAVMQSAEI